MTWNLVLPKQSQTVEVWAAKAYGQEAGGLEGFGNHFRVGLQIEYLGDSHKQEVVHPTQWFLEAKHGNEAKSHE